MATAQAQLDTKWWSGGKSPFNVEYGKLMMWYFLMSDAFTFGAFLISYGTIRFSQNYWPDPNHVFNAFPGAGHANLPLAFVSLMTFILIISSVTMVLAVHAGHHMDKKGVIKWMAWTIVGGFAFLACQAWEWTHLITGHHAVLIDGKIQEIGTTVTHNPWGPYVPNLLHNGEPVSTTGPVAFGGYFFGITGFHGFHVFSGVVINIIMLLMTINGVFDRKGHYQMIEKAGLYWHFVDLVWVFVFLCFYLI
ncbi:cytochrome c oxidase subunit 3 [Pollutibacter soli]|jgi:cytochrome c oxidase subunit 3|uniref:cytochrome c oxidase subunit 3 n=1 Tax=Pollutibacter soli TaxID=3034157 RepID=UPI003013D530